MALLYLFPMRCPTLTIIKNCLYIALVLYKLCRHTALFVFGASLEYPKRPWFLGPSFPIVNRALEDNYLVLTWYKYDTQKYEQSIKAMFL